MPRKPALRCDNCGSPVSAHCRVHLIRCCPGKCSSYIVGERGPELFVPERAGTILPKVPPPESD